jgi:hypothetical protein
MKYTDASARRATGLTRRRLLAIGAVAVLPFLTGGECGGPYNPGPLSSGASFDDAKPALRAKFGNLSSAELFLKWEPMSHGEVIRMIDDYNRKERAKKVGTNAPAGAGSEKTGDGGGGGGGGD